jgi:hypothetical protein
MAAAWFTLERPGSVTLFAKTFVASVTVDIFKADRKFLVVYAQCSLSAASSPLHQQLARNLVTTVTSMVDDKNEYGAMISW